MQATKGRKDFAPAWYRLRGSLIVGLVSALVLSALGLASSAGAAEPPQKKYLALGDSVAFGFSKELLVENYPQEDPKKFEEAAPTGSGKPNGYVRDLEIKLKAAPVIEGSQWQRAINDGCPGETSDSIIGVGPLRTQLAAKGLPVEPEPENEVGSPADYPHLAETGWVNRSIQNKACLYHNNPTVDPFNRVQPLGKYHLHHEYGDGKSQLESALQTIQHENSGGNLTKHPIQLITYAIGANDELRGIGLCKAEIKFEYANFAVFGYTDKSNVHHQFTSPDSRYNHNPFYEEKTAKNVGTNEKQALIGCVKGHTGDIFIHILRNIFTLDKAIRQGGTIELCVNASSPCDKAHKAVNYTGKLSWLGSYNPLGSVFQETTNACQLEEPPEACNHEVVEGSNLLQGFYNADVKEVNKPFGACFANPQPSWNPGSPSGGEMPATEWGEGPPNAGPTPGLWPYGGNEKGEPFDVSPYGTLQHYTNMANFSYERGEITKSDGSAEVTNGSKIIKHVQGLNNGFKSTTELKSAFSVKENEEEGTLPDEATGANIPPPVNPFGGPPTTPTGSLVQRIGPAPAFGPLPALAAGEIELTKAATGTAKESISFKRADGAADIHPTPLGYEKLAELLNECP